MAPDYKTYLAANVLNEGNIVTYRSLSHEFKIHANTAKKILADFHTVQNARSNGSVHATYLISGFKEAPAPGPAAEDLSDDKEDAAQNAEDTNGNEDIPMSSNPLPSSSAPQPKDEPSPELRRAITLVREEHLEGAKLQYAEVTAVHVYSLESVSPKDLQMLTIPNRAIAAKFAEEDPLENTKLYGVIQNPNVKRRTKHSQTAKPPQSNPQSKPAAASSVKSEPSNTPTASKAAAKSTGKPGLKKENSDLFKSFAKAKPKPLKEKAPAEDVPMRDVSDDGGDEEPVSKPDMTSTKLKEERQGREERLRAMMDDDNQAMSNTNDKEHESEEEAEPEPEPEPEVLNEPALKQTSSKLEEEQPHETVEGGRRRGKRKVMKKITMKDEEGYLITKEEAVWESYSEDDTPAPPKSSKPMISSGKPKAGGAKGQGNITSFFGKK